MIFNVQRYSTHDGPGIRTVVFLKGCSLKCTWCQNPESRSATADVLYDARLCSADCQHCAKTFPHAVSVVNGRITVRKAQFQAEDLCQIEQVCPSGALSVCGDNANIDALMQQILRDKPFYTRTGGGVTLSGGEPFMQPHTALNLLQRCRHEGLHTAVESCLHVPWHYIQPSLGALDLMLADLKHVADEPFRRLTGGSAKRVKDNFRRLAAAGQKLIVRVPLIPEFNADRASIRQIVDFAANETGCEAIHFLPYHTLGINKYALLGQPYLAPRQPLNDPDLLTFAEEYATEKGLCAQLRG
ncbi:glycyl-radical enzyme activating protein [Rahnella perminowiae]|uniref:glycyl-radical enzyme activating protein n=1 Tax=Rahnella perminowiae TaxID=2816244 RepID=UPI00215D5821|nr:glycyl-radical enzyme activating protein [Rahnella perminowiae]MCR9001086.1 glycyl-radical enzyme activating protein [Rahnella perminowiae]